MIATRPNMAIDWFFSRCQDMSKRAGFKFYIQRRRDAGTFLGIEETAASVYVQLEDGRSECRKKPDSMRPLVSNYNLMRQFENIKYAAVFNSESGTLHHREGDNVYVLKYNFHKDTPEHLQVLGGFIGDGNLKSVTDIPHEYKSILRGVRFTVLTGNLF